MRVEVLSSSREYDGFFQFDRAVLRFERFDGEMTQPVERLVFERGDSVAVLLHDPRYDTVVLVEQFRFPAFLREMPAGRLLEVVAGTVDLSRSPEEVARTELVEEAGYEVEKLEPVGLFYVSPGACTERIHLYIGRIAAGDRAGSGGGVDEGEDIRVHQVPFETALRWARDGTIRDAKTIIALQHLALQRRSADG
jgi:ADP-ribose pyrophosphatase